MIFKKQFNHMPKKLQRALILVLIYLFSRLVKFIALAIFPEKSLDPDDMTLFALEVILIWFLVFKIKEQKSWAKIMLLVLFLFHALSLPWTFASEALWSETLLISPITAIQLIIVIMILTSLFNKDSDYWFKNSENKPTVHNNKNSTKKTIIKYWLILPVSLSIFGFLSGCNVNTGGGNLNFLFLLLLGPMVLGLGLIILLIMFTRGKKKKNESLVNVSKIGLYLISIPIAFVLGVFVSHNFL